jgi:aminotransferase
VKDATCRAIRADVNQYAITWGAQSLREAIAEKAAWANGLTVDPERHVTVCCGATEAMLSTLLAIVDPGDEVVVFEPFYENYGPDAILCGAIPRFVTLHEPDWTFDEAELAAAFGPRTKAIILNTPNNPTGKVFSREELELVAKLCVQHGVIGITDEIYEHIVYDGTEHVTLGSLPGMEELSVTINAMSKTYSVTGWRVGWAIACEELTSAIRKVHDFATVGAAAPLQEAGAEALRLPRSYYEKMRQRYEGKRDKIVGALLPRREGGGGGGPGLELLRGSGEGARPAAFQFLQEGRDPRPGAREAGTDRGGFAGCCARLIRRPRAASRSAPRFSA